MSNVVYEWNSICEFNARKVAEESVSRDCMTGFAGEYEEGDDWAEPGDEEITEEDLGLITELDEWDEVGPQLQELTDIPYFLYKECREEGMTKEKAIEETRNRFWE